MTETNAGAQASATNSEAKPSHPASQDPGMPRPKSAPELLAKLEALEIAHKTYQHEPVFTVDESDKIKIDMPGAHSKNLFLRNKKGKMWLFSTLGDKKIDLKLLGDKLGAGRLSFGSADRLMQNLGVIPGAVTPFATINDSAGAVQMVLDEDFLGYDIVNFHPLDNAMTTALHPKELLRFLEAVDHPAQMLQIDGA